MRKSIYFILLLGISLGFFLLGMYYQANASNLNTCREWAIAGDVYLSECDIFITIGLISYLVFIFNFIALMFLNRRMWKKI